MIYVYTDTILVILCVNLQQIGQQIVTEAELILNHKTL